MDKLTQEERAALKEMAQVCHEELVKGIPPAIIFPICNKCSKRLTKSTTCKVYPNGIPKEILTKKSDCKQFSRE